MKKILPLLKGMAQLNNLLIATLISVGIHGKSLKSAKGY
jgi:hypothetical protein